MNFLKEWAIALLILLCFISLFAGYFWRIHHEHKNFGKWKQAIVKEFLMEVEEEDRQVFQFDQWIFVKRADGSIVIKRR